MSYPVLTGFVSVHLIAVLCTGLPVRHLSCVKVLTKRCPQLLFSGEQVEVRMLKANSVAASTLKPLVRSPLRHETEAKNTPILVGKCYYHSMYYLHRCCTWNVICSKPCNYLLIFGR